jgi:hypothetical protein
MPELSPLLELPAEVMPELGPDVVLFVVLIWTLMARLANAAVTLVVAVSSDSGSSSSVMHWVSVRCTSLVANLNLCLA